MLQENRKLAALTKLTNETKKLNFNQNMECTHLA
jgi:hypothetical protein